MVFGRAEATPFTAETVLPRQPVLDVIAEGLQRVLGDGFEELREEGAGLSDAEGLDRARRALAP